VISNTLHKHTHPLSIPQHSQAMSCDLEVLQLEVGDCSNAAS